MNILSSRRFWSLLVSQIVAVGLFIVANYVNDPKTVELIKVIVVAGDSVAAFLIAALTVDDSRANTAQIKADAQIQVAAIAAGTHPAYPAVPCEEEEADR